MIVRAGQITLLFYIAWSFLLLDVAASPLSTQIATETINLRITGVDRSDFPTMQVRLAATGNGSVPITDLSRLVMRENGIPVTITSFESVAAGVDVALVLDANADFLLVDDNSDLSRRDKAAVSIDRFAAQFMDPAGLDRVSIIVPDEAGSGGRFLVTDAADPLEVSAAIPTYSPATLPRLTPLNGMLALAIEHLAAQKDSGRLGAVLLYTDAGQLDRQLDYPALVEAAQSAGVPIFVAILGSQASEEEISSAANLYQPTGGQYLHMPQPESADPFYSLFQALGQQNAITFESPLTESGTRTISASLGNRQASTTIDLVLAAPLLSLDVDRPIIRRVGSAPDTPLALLQPAALPVTARVSWPDGQPRDLTGVVFLVNGIAQPQGIMPMLNSAGQLPLIWDISGLETGSYVLTAEIVDELGFQAAAAPVTVQIEISRPAAPTPTPVPTAAPLISWPGRDDGAATPVLVGLLLLAPVGLGIGGLVWLIRKRRTTRPTPTTTLESPAVSRRPPSTDQHIAILEWVDENGIIGERIELLSNDITLGREADAVDIIIDDPSISRLHARLRLSPDNTFWLYDEGSSRGTYLNYERLGLAPRQIQHGDIIRLGRILLRFMLELPRPDADSTATENKDT